jgi:DNA-binding response OmpR family regulator
LGYRAGALDTLAALDESLRVAIPDMLILDAVLPDGSAMALLSHLRGLSSTMGIIILIDRMRSQDHLYSLTMGADYALVKPVTLPELEATLAALGRRLGAGASIQDPDDLSWFYESGVRRVHGPGGLVVELSENEARLFSVLVRAMPMPVARRQLIEALGEALEGYDAHRLESMIHRLRRRLQPPGDEPGLILRSVYGVGYACRTRVRVLG